MNKSYKIPVITIDGPTASGKGTISRGVAARLQWNLLDSGALYRIVAWVALERNLPFDQENLLVTVAEQLETKFNPQDPLQTKIYFENQEITDLVRMERVSQAASHVAQYQDVRKALVSTQHAFRQPPGLVADGRDMGTQIFKDASLKIYLTATVEERARRRLYQLKEKGIDVMLSNLIHEIKQRDERDMNRAIAPLIPAQDAWIVDTTDRTIESVVESILAEWARVINRS